MALWFECKVRYDKMQDNGAVKKVTEPYLVDALTFTDAETRVVEELRPYISGEYSVSAEKKTKISEIFFDSSDYADKYWMVKVAFITLDEKSGREKKTSTFILVQAGDFDQAVESFKDGMKGTMSDWRIESVSETLLMDVFPYSNADDRNGDDDG